MAVTRSVIRSENRGGEGEGRRDEGRGKEEGRRRNESGEILIPIKPSIRSGLDRKLPQFSRPRDSYRSLFSRLRGIRILPLIIRDDVAHCERRGVRCGIDARASARRRGKGACGLRNNEFNEAG